MPLIKEENINDTLVIGVWHSIESLSELEADVLLLATDEIELKKTRLHKRKIEKILTRVLAKSLLENHFHLPYQGIKKLESGKPVLIGTDLELSVSHCEHYLTVLLSKKDKAGIDIQHVNEKIEKVAPRIFSDQELEQIGQSKQFLARAWSAKEAMFKYYEKGKINFKRDLHLYHISDPDKFHGIFTCGGKEIAVNLGVIEFNKFYQLVYCIEK